MNDTAEIGDDNILIREEFERAATGTKPAKFRNLV